MTLNVYTNHGGHEICDVKSVVDLVLFVSVP
jgi:hypothetical protein